MRHDRIKQRQNQKSATSTITPARAIVFVTLAIILLAIKGHYNLEQQQNANLRTNLPITVEHGEDLTR